MPRTATLVVLSSWRSPILAPTVNTLSSAGVPVNFIVFDGEEDDRSLAIHRERTQGYFKEHSVFDMEGLHIPCFFVKELNSPGSLSLLGRLKADLLVNGGIRSILRPPLLSVARIGVVNSHPGLLPKYRGCTCLEWAIYNDDPIGSTCHFMNEKIDAGPLVYGEEMPVFRGQPYEELRSRIIDHSASVLSKGIRRILEEGLRPEELPAPPTGNYFRVIAQEQLEKVKEKLRTGTYGRYADAAAIAGLNGAEI